MEEKYGFGTKMLKKKICFMEVILMRSLYTVWMLLKAILTIGFMS